MQVQPLPQSQYAQTPWPQQRLDPSRVWPLTRGAGVTVAVIDSGVDGQAPGLAGAGKVRPGIDELHQGPTADYDCVGHGTLVAGLIAAGPVSGAAFEGVAPDAIILPIRQTAALSETNGTPYLVTAIYDAVAHDAKVINISVTLTNPDPALEQAVDYALGHNVVIVAAAGNDYGNGNPPEYPAAYPGVLAVGAIDQSGQRSSFSETGTPVSVVAPGSGIVGPAAGFGELIEGAAGTSFSAPLVTGVVALVRAYHPDLTPVQVVKRIEATADRVPGATPDPQYGWGVVDPYAAVTAVLPGESEAAVAPQPPQELPLPPLTTPPSRHDLHTAEAASAAAAILAVLIALVARLSPRGRERRWRPGGWRVS